MNPQDLKKILKDAIETEIALCDVIISFLRIYFPKENEFNYAKNRFETFLNSFHLDGYIPDADYYFDEVAKAFKKEVK